MGAGWDHRGRRADKPQEATGHLYASAADGALTLETPNIPLEAAG